jgi:hypothetical protein
MRCWTRRIEFSRLVVPLGIIVCADSLSTSANDRRQEISEVLLTGKSEPLCVSYGPRHDDVQIGVNLAPFMIHELLLSPTETASGSHPCCVVSVTYHRPSYFHGGNTGSNSVGDAKSIIYRNNVCSLFSRDTASGRPAGISRAGKWLGVVTTIRPLPLM